MKTEKEIYYHLAENCKIYLPADVLAQVTQELKNCKSIFQVLSKIENDPALKQYTSRSKGAYEMNQAEKVQVKQLDPETKVLIAEFDSLCDAAKAVGKDKGFGNISNAVKSGKTAYGFLWSN